MSTIVTYTPPVGSAVVFTTGTAAALRLLQLEGIGPVSMSPYSVKSPGQAGDTLSDIITQPRVITLQGLIQESTHALAWTARAAVARAFAVEPLGVNGTMVLGTLQIERDGSPTYEIACIARSVSFIRSRGSIASQGIDIELLAPTPWWKELTDVDTVFASASTASITNGGDVSTPILATFTGAFTQVILTNDTYSEGFTIDSALGGADSLDVNTAFGGKTIELVTGGVGVSEMANLDAAASFLWLLRPGSNSITFANTGGGAVTVSHRNQFSGI